MMTAVQNLGLVMDLKIVPIRPMDVTSLVMTVMAVTVVLTVVMMVVVMFMDVQIWMLVTMIPMQLWMMVAAKSLMTVVSAVVMV